VDAADAREQKSRRATVSKKQKQKNLRKSEETGLLEK
jgi:hypothetical protein